MAHNVATGSFCKDNFARRQIKQLQNGIPEQVQTEISENIASAIVPTMTYYRLAGTYTAPLDSEALGTGITSADFNVSVRDVKGLIITIEGISLGADTYQGNKDVEIKVFDKQNNTLFTMYDENSNVSIEYFNCIVSPKVLASAILSGRALNSGVESEEQGFYHKQIGLNTGVFFPTETQIGDFRIRFRTNAIVQNHPIVFRLYVQI